MKLWQNPPAIIAFTANSCYRLKNFNFPASGRAYLAITPYFSVNLDRGKYEDFSKLIVKPKLQRWFTLFPDVNLLLSGIYFETGIIS
jgi:hypothetical protein